MFRYPLEIVRGFPTKNVWKLSTKMLIDIIEPFGSNFKNNNILSSSPLKPHYSCLPSHALFVSPANAPKDCWPVKEPLQKVRLSVARTPQLVFEYKSAPGPTWMIVLTTNSHAHHSPKLYKPGARLQNPFNKPDPNLKTQLKLLNLTSYIKKREWIKRASYKYP